MYLYYIHNLHNLFYINFRSFLNIFFWFSCYLLQLFKVVQEKNNQQNFLSDKETKVLELKQPATWEWFIPGKWNSVCLIIRHMVWEEKTCESLGIARSGTNWSTGHVSMWRMDTSHLLFFVSKNFSLAKQWCCVDTLGMLLTNVCVFLSLF